MRKPVFAFYDIHHISYIVFADKDCEQLGQSDSAFAKYVHKIADFYFAYHHEAYDIRGIFLFISLPKKKFTIWCFLKCKCHLFCNY